MMMLIEINKIEKERLKGTNEPDTHSVHKQRNAMKYSEFRTRLLPRARSIFFSSIPLLQTSAAFTFCWQILISRQQNNSLWFFSLNLPKHMLTYTYSSFIWSLCFGNTFLCCSIKIFASIPSPFKLNVMHLISVIDNPPNEKTTA